MLVFYSLPRTDWPGVASFLGYNGGMFPKARFLSLLVVACLVTIAGIHLPSHQGALAFYAHYTTPISGSANVAAAAASGFNSTLQYVIAGGYIIMFIGMVVEGPVITAAAAFAAALGYFNIFIVFLLAIFGDLAADVTYYAIGYFSRVTFVEKYGHRFGMSKARMEHLEHLLKRHPGKTLLVLKLIPGIATPGLMMVGVTHMSPRRFATLCTSIILPKVLLFMALGYYFGRTYDLISKYVTNAEYFIIFAIIATLCIYYIYSKATSSFAARLVTI